MATMIYKWFLVFGFWFLGESVTVHDRGQHPFYVSVMEVNHNATDKTLEISCRVFAEDIEEILEKNYKTTLDITDANDMTRFNELLPDYFSSRLSFAVDGKKVQISYLGFEVDKEAAYCYFQVDHINAAKKIDVVNSVLYDFNENQINIMHVTVNGKRNSTKLVYPEKSASFIFNE